MPFPFILGLFALIGLAAAIAFWPQILDWAHKTLFPFFEDYLPFLLPLVREAFVAFDKLAVGVRRVAQKAWNMLRPHLLSLVMRFNKAAQGAMRELEGWLSVDGSSNTVERVYSREPVAWEDLPDEVRDALTRKRKTAEVDVLKTRELELEH